MQRSASPRRDLSDRELWWLLVSVAAAGLMVLTPYSAAGQAATARDLSLAAWRTDSHPQLPRRRPSLTAAQRDGMRWGARIGGLAGLVAGAVLYARRDCEEEECLLAPVAAVVSVGFGVALGTIGGMGIGLVVGSVNDGSRESQLHVGLRIGSG